MSDARVFCVVTYMTNETLANDDQVMLKMTQLTKILLRTVRRLESPISSSPHF